MTTFNWIKIDRLCIQVHCESNKMENEDIVSVILYDTTRFTIGDKYRFCLVLVQRQTDHPELIVGCSNITKLKQIENILVIERTNEPLSMPITSTKSPEYVTRKSPAIRAEEVISDISSFEKITDRLLNEPQHAHEKIFEREPTTTVHREEMSIQSTTLKSSQMVPVEKAYASQLMNHFNDGLMPSLSIGVLITSVFAFIWAANKLTSHRRSIPSSVCYAAADQHSVDIENSNRYLKLQATTTLWKRSKIRCHQFIEKCDTNSNVSSLKYHLTHSTQIITIIYVNLYLFLFYVRNEENQNIETIRNERVSKKKKQAN